MGIYHRKDSPYWWICLERPGQRAIRESTRIPVQGVGAAQTKDLQHLAEQIYAARMGDLARQRYRLPVDKPTLTFRAFRDWYRAHVSTTKRGWYREASMLRQLGRYFDDRLLHTITREDGHEWASARAEEVAPATVNRELALMKHALGHAVPKYLDANPWARLGELPVDQDEPRILSDAEEGPLLAAADDETRALLICALDTLQRLSNVVALRRAQDHGASLTVHHPKAKGRSDPYRVPVSTRLRAALDGLPADGPFYFPSYARRCDRCRNASRACVGCEGWSRNKLVRRFEILCRQAGLPVGRRAGGLSFHCLRHTGASRMLARGTDVQTVARIGNWRDIRVLQKYLHAVGDADRRAVEAVSLAGSAGTLP